MIADNWEDVYPLAPLQEGVLFDTLLAARSGVDAVQAVVTWQANVDVPAFRRAWQRVSDRHPSLRTTFRWLDVPEPVQVVQPEVKFDFDYADLGDLHADQQECLFRAYLEADRHRPVDLERGPLTRLKLFRMGDAEFRFVWYMHHILLDGYAYVMMLDEAFTFYEAFCRGEDLQLERPRPFRDHVMWLRSLDMAPSRAYWRHALAGFTWPTRLLADRAPCQRLGDLDTHAELEIVIPQPVTMALQACGAEHGVTLNSIVQGAWALLLSIHSDDEDIVFGVTRAGRGGCLPEAKRMAGVFSNVVPMRVCCAPWLSVISFLQQLREQQLAVRPYERLSLAEVQRLSDVPRGTPLFETLLTFGNSSEENVLAERWLGRTFRRLSQTNFPQTLKAYGGREIFFTMAYYPRRFEAATIAHLLNDLRTILEEFARNPAGRLADARQAVSCRAHQAHVSRSGLVQHGAPRLQRRTLQLGPVELSA